jgi:hypothetical protein
VPLGQIIDLPALASAHAAPRRLTVWLPPGYDRGDRSYPVLYLHDGDLITDPAGSSFHAGIGATLAALAAGGAAEPAIVVGIWSGPQRLREFSPAAFLPDLPPSLRLRAEAACGGPSLADGYLRYLTEELKPAIDRLFRTRRNCSDTAIMGSGMGGLAALYAVARRPGIFGSAGWIAGPRPLVPYRKTIVPCGEVKATERAFAHALDRAIPRAGTHRFYLDYGDAGADLFSMAFQAAAEPVLYERGYRRGRDLACEGAPRPDLRQVSDDEKVRAALSLMLRPCGCTDSAKLKTTLESASDELKQLRKGGAASA